MRAWFVALAFAAILMLPVPRPSAAAEAEADREDGYLTAFAYLPYPAGAPLQLDPRDDATDVLALLATFRRVIERHGHTVDPAADLMLTFDLVQEDDLSLIDRRGGQRPPVMSFGGRSDPRVEFGINPEPRFSLVVPLGESLGTIGRPPGDIAHYCLSAAVTERRSRRRVWSAELRFAADYYNHLAVAHAMVPVLLDALGQTIGRLSVTYQ